MARVAAVITICGLAAVAAVPTQNTPTHIRIGSFNIVNFGDTNEYERSLISLVNIIREMGAGAIASRLL